MLIKLIKYEFRSILRILIPISIAFVVMTGLTFVVSSFSYDNIILKFIPSIMTLLYFVNLVMLMAAAYLFTIYRFYKNLITSEGYLMFTLPVSAGMLIKSKLITALVTQVASVVLCIVSLLTLSYAKYSLFDLTSFLQSFDEMASMTRLNGAVLITIVILFSLLSLILNNLMFYASIALGHTVAKNKIIGSVLCYIIINTVPQVVAVVLMIAVGFIVNHTIILPIIITIVGVLNFVGCSALYYLTRHYLSKKLNLE